MLGSLAVLSSLVVAGAMLTQEPAPYVVVLGVAQDAGHPQAGCRKACCAAAIADPSRGHLVSSIAVVDPVSGGRWLFDATPDFRPQMRRLEAIAPQVNDQVLDGVFITHAHIGHYTGLMYLGHESIGASRVPTYVMPRMTDFLMTNAPWEQLVKFRNLKLVGLTDNTPVVLNERLTVTPIRVPHRDEYSETVAFRITGPERSVLFLPDIDKWDRWDRKLEDELALVDVAYLDGTFHADGELPGRDMSAIPHPFVTETMTRLASQPAAMRERVRFIHFNHTNPALDPTSAAYRAIHDAGFRVAAEGERVTLGVAATSDPAP